MKKVCMVVILTFFCLGLVGCGKENEKYYCCEMGTITENGNCYVEKNFDVLVTYTCPDGYIVGNYQTCYRSDGTRAMAASKTYECPYGGSLVNNKCVDIYYMDAYECTEQEYMEQNNKFEDYTKEVVVDNYVGKDYQEVKKELENKGFIVVIEKVTSANDENTILSQSISPGVYTWTIENNKVIEGITTITLTIPEIINTYPDFTNGSYTLDDIYDFADANNLILNISYEKSTLASGTILSQSREAGKEVVPRTRLNIVIAE